MLLKCYQFISNKCHRLFIRLQLFWPNPNPENGIIKDSISDKVKHARTNSTLITMAKAIPGQLLEILLMSSNYYRSRGFVHVACLILQLSDSKITHLSFKSYHKASYNWRTDWTVFLFTWDRTWVAERERGGGRNAKPHRTAFTVTLERFFFPVGESDRELGGIYRLDSRVRLIFSKFL